MMGSTKPWAGGLAAVLLSLLWPFALDAGQAPSEAPRPWSLMASAAAITLEGGSAGHGAALTAAWRIPYQSPATPQSFFAFEWELLETIDPFRRGRDERRIDGELRSAGLYLAANTFVAERAFFRARLGGLYRYLNESHRDARHQTRIGAGLGVGYRLGSRADLVADATVHYWGLDSRLFMIGTAGVRFHF